MAQRRLPSHLRHLGPIHLELTARPEPELVRQNKAQVLEKTLRGQQYLLGLSCYCLYSNSSSKCWMGRESDCLSFWISAGAAKNLIWKTSPQNIWTMLLFNWLSSVWRLGIHSNLLRIAWILGSKELHCTILSRKKKILIGLAKVALSVPG